MENKLKQGEAHFTETQKVSLNINIYNDRVIEKYEQE